MTAHCEHEVSGGCGGAVLAYALENQAWCFVALCQTHRRDRADIAVRDWGDLACLEERTEEIFRLHQAYLAAEAAFVQRYDPAAKCGWKGRDACSGGVAAYYGSDGGKGFLCQRHREQSNAIMSVQYYEEVYDKSGTEFHDAWSAAMYESRQAAQKK